MDTVNDELKRQAELVEQAAAELKAKVKKEVKGKVNKVNLELARKQKKKKISAFHRRPNCLIFVERLKLGIYRYIAPKHIPAGAGAVDYMNMQLFFLGLDLKNKFWLLEPPRKIVEGETPTDLFMAKHCAAEVEEVYGLSLPTMEKIKLGILVGLCIAIMIVIFLIVSAAGGG